MKVYDVVKRYFNGMSNGNGSNIRIDGNRLVQYSTTIVTQNADGTYTLNARYYSVTTSKVQNYCRQIAKEMGITLIEKA